MPLSAFISTAKIWEVMIPNPIIHSTTFGGNPLACAAGLAAIQVTLEEDLPGQAAAKGEFLLRELGCLQQKYPQVLKEAHGKGLLIGMEFPVQEIGWQVASGLFKRGVLVAGTYSRAQVIRIEPALGIPMDLLQEMLNRLEDTFREVAAPVCSAVGKRHNNKAATWPPSSTCDAGLLRARGGLRFCPGRPSTS